MNTTRVPIRQLVEEGFKLGPVTLVVDTRVAGVSVPPRYEGVINLKLNFSPRFKPGDCEPGDDGISQTLSFNGEPFRVTVPWFAVLGFKLANGDVGVLFEHVPPEVQERFAVAIFEPFEKQPVVAKKPTLRVIH